MRDRPRRDQDPVTAVEAGHRRSLLGDHTNGLVAEDASVGDCRDVSGQDVEIGSANGCRIDANDHVCGICDGGICDGGIGDIFPGLAARTVVAKCLQDLRSWRNVHASDDAIPTVGTAGRAEADLSESETAPEPDARSVVAALGLLCGTLGSLLRLFVGIHLIRLNQGRRAASQARGNPELALRVGAVGLLQTVQ